jgi:hypothetical protein
MAEEVMQEKKKKKKALIIVLPLVLVLILAYAWLLKRSGVSNLQLFGGSNTTGTDHTHESALNVQTNKEIKEFEDIIIACESEVVDEHGYYVEGDVGEGQISKERYEQMVEECVNELNKNDDFEFKYSGE